MTGAKNSNNTMCADLEVAVREKNAALERVRTFDEREAELVRQLQFMDDVRRKLHNRVIQLTGNIRVFVRVRPMLPSEEQVSLRGETVLQQSSTTPHRSDSNAISPSSFSTLFAGDEPGRNEAGAAQG